MRLLKIFLRLNRILFQKTSYKHQLTKYKDNDAELGSKQLTALASCSADKWKKFWKHIKTFYFSLDVNTDHIHIFNLGLKLWTFVNKPQCLFCGRQVETRFSRDLIPDEFLTHVYLECRATYLIWAYCQYPSTQNVPDRTWSLFIANASLDTKQIRTINRYHLILLKVQDFRLSQKQESERLPALRRKAAKKLVSYYISALNL